MKLLKWIAIGSFVFLLIIGGVFWFASTHKEEVRAYLISEIRKNFSGKVEIGAFDLAWLDGFPLLSAQFSDLSVTDSLYHLHKRKLLEAKKVSFQINTWKLLFAIVSVERVAVEGVHINMLKMANGYDNSKIVKLKGITTERSAKKMPPITVDELIITDLKFKLEDLGEGKNISFSVLRASSKLFPTDSVLHFQLYGEAHSDGLTFVKVFGPYLSNADIALKVTGFYDHRIPQINFTGTKASILGATYNVDGWISPSDTASMDMHIYSDIARLELVVPYLTDTLSNTLKKIQVANPVKGHMRIFGRLIPRVDPHIYLTFSTKKNTISYKSVPLTLTGVSFNGRFHNYQNPSKNPSDPNSLMEILSFSGNLGALPISASAEIEDFIHPKLSVDGKLSADFENLEEYTANLPLENLTGKLALDFSLKKADVGKLFEIAKTHKLKNFTGLLQLKDVGFNYKNSESDVERLSAKLKINNDSLSIDDLFLKYSGNPVHLKGKFYGLIPYLIHPENVLEADLSVYSERFNVDNLLKSDGRAPIKRKRVHKRAKIDKVAVLYARNLHFRFKLNADKLSFRKLQATNVSALIEHTGESTTVKDLSMNALGGSFGINCKLEPLTGPNKILNSNVSIRSVDISQLFASMDNFSQNVIGSENIGGNFTADITYNTSLNSDFSIITNSMNGEFDFKLRDGRLKDFEPLLRLSKFVFKKRQLDDIEFDEIQNHVKLRGKEVTIPDMSIASSAFSFFVKGTYNFDDVTDMQIKVPLSNFLRWEPGIEKNILYADSSGINLLLTAKTIDGKLKMALGLGKIFKRKK